MNELRDFMRPELINRFDEVIVFEPLKYQHMTRIVELQFKALRKLLEEQSIGFDWTAAAIKEVVHSGFDPIYGARPLKRTIQKLIENPISTLIIEKKVAESDQIIVDFDGDNFVFNIEKVELVPEDSVNKNAKKKYFCESCGNNFETLVVNNSTVICNRCVSKKVQEVIESNQEIIGNKSETRTNEEKLVEKKTPPQGTLNTNDAQAKKIDTLTPDKISKGATDTPVTLNKPESITKEPDPKLQTTQPKPITI